MRVYEIDDIMKAKGSGCGLEVEIEALQRLQDNVNRTQWKICVFSGTYVIKEVWLNNYY